MDCLDVCSKQLGVLAHHFLVFDPEIKSNVPQKVGCFVDELLNKLSVGWTVYLCVDAQTQTIQVKISRKYHDWSVDRIEKIRIFSLPRLIERLEIVLQKLTKIKHRRTLIDHGIAPPVVQLGDQTLNVGLTLSPFCRIECADEVSISRINREDFFDAACIDVPLRLDEEILKPVQDKVSDSIREEVKCEMDVGHFFTYLHFLKERKLDLYQEAQNGNISRIIAFIVQEKRASPTFLEEVLPHYHLAALSSDQQKQFIELIPYLADLIDLDNEGVGKLNDALINFFAGIPSLKVDNLLKNKSTCGVIKRLLDRYEKKLSNSLLKVLIILAESARNKGGNAPSSRPWVELFADLLLKADEYQYYDQLLPTQFIGAVSLCIDQSFFAKEITAFLKETKKENEEGVLYAKAFQFLGESFYVSKLADLLFHRDHFRSFEKLDGRKLEVFRQIYSKGNVDKYLDKFLNLVKYQSVLFDIETCYPQWVFIWDKLKDKPEKLKIYFIQTLQQSITGTSACMRAYEQLHTIPVAAAWLEESNHFDLSGFPELSPFVINRLRQLVEFNRIEKFFNLLKKGIVHSEVNSYAESIVGEVYSKNPEVSICRIVNDVEQLLPLLLKKDVVVNPRLFKVLISKLIDDEYCPFSVSTKSRIGVSFLPHVLENGSLFSTEMLAKICEFYFVYLDEDQLFELTLSCASQMGPHTKKMFSLGVNVLEKRLGKLHSLDLQAALNWFHLLLEFKKENDSLISYYSNIFFDMFKTDLVSHKEFIEHLYPYLDSSRHVHAAEMYQDKIVKLLKQSHSAETISKRIQNERHKREIELFNSLPIAVMQDLVKVHHPLALYFLDYISLLVSHPKGLPAAANGILREIVTYTNLMENREIFNKTVPILAALKDTEILNRMGSFCVFILGIRGFRIDSELMQLYLIVFSLWLEGDATRGVVVQVCMHSLINDVEHLHSPFVYQQVAEIARKGCFEVDWHDLTDYIFKSKPKEGDAILLAIARQEVNLLAMIFNRILLEIKQSPIGFSFNRTVIARIQPYLSIILEKSSHLPLLLPYVREVADCFLHAFYPGALKNGASLPPILNAEEAHIIEVLGRILMGGGRECAVDVCEIYRVYHVYHFSHVAILTVTDRDIAFFFDYVRWVGENQLIESRPIIHQGAEFMLQMIGTKETIKIENPDFFLDQYMDCIVEMVADQRCENSFTMTLAFKLVAWVIEHLSEDDFDWIDRVFKRNLGDTPLPISLFAYLLENSSHRQNIEFGEMLLCFKNYIEWDKRNGHSKNDKLKRLDEKLTQEFIYHRILFYRDASVSSEVMAYETAIFLAIKVCQSGETKNIQKLTDKQVIHLVSTLLDISLGLVLLCMEKIQEHRSQLPNAVFKLVNDHIADHPVEEDSDDLMLIERIKSLQK